MPPQSQILFGTDTTRIEYFPAEISDRSSKIAFTFSAATNRRLAGNFDGGAALARHGFDVIAFKSVSDDWFQSLPGDALDIVGGFIADRGYGERVAYGTSAGGFAAVAFSKRLHCTKVLAISPQYSIREDFDTRWKWLADPLAWRHNITPETVAAGCEYTWVFDNRCIDAVHIARINETIGKPSAVSGKPSAVSEIHMPYVGHNVGICLNQIGALTNLPIDIFTKRVDLPGLAIRLNRGKKISTVYLNNLSLCLLKKGWDSAAFAVMQRGSDIDPNFLNNFRYDRDIIRRFTSSIDSLPFQQKAGGLHVPALA